MQKKEFGKYSVDELSILASYPSQLRSLWDEIREEIDNATDRLRGQFITPFFWSQAYEFDFNKHIACLVSVMGFVSELSALASNENPQAATIEFAEKEATSGLSEQLDDPKMKTQAFGLLFSLLCSIDSLVIHGRLLNELIRDVRGGSDVALFKAARIDRTVLGCKPVADRIAWAEATNDAEFFKKLSNALRSRPKKPKEEYAPLRYVLYVLEEAEALDTLTLERAYTLFCVELKLYPDEGPDPARKLWQFIARWKKTRST